MWPPLSGRTRWHCRWLELCDEERHFQIAVSGGGFRTDLTLQGTHQHLEEASAALALTYRPSALSFQVSAGAVLAGSLTGPLGDYDVKPGFLASASVGYTFLDGEGPRPYLAVSGTAGVSMAPTRSRASTEDRPDLTATDLRAWVVLGKRLELLAPPALEAFVEVGFRGEQAVVGGLGWAF